MVLYTARSVCSVATLSAIRCHPLCYPLLLSLLSVAHRQQPRHADSRPATASGARQRPSASQSPASQSPATQSLAAQSASSRPVRAVRAKRPSEPETGRATPTDAPPARQKRVRIMVRNPRAVRSPPVPPSVEVAAPAHFRAVRPDTVERALVRCLAIASDDTGGRVVRCCHSCGAAAAGLLCAHPLLTVSLFPALLSPLPRQRLP